MRELLLNSKVRLILALVVIVGIVGSLGGVYYLGQVNKSKALKGTKSKASVNTLDTRIETACMLEFNIVKPTPTLAPTATPLPTQIPTKTPTPTVPVCIGNADIALVIDRSSTMTDKESDGRQKMEWAKDAAIAFVDTLQKSGKTNVRVSISSFGIQGNDGTGVIKPVAENNSTLHSPLSSDYAVVKNAISNIKYVHSGTCIQCGIRIGNETLKDSPNPKYLILLSDGMANHTWNGGTSNSKTAAINEAKAPGVTYYTLGYGAGSEIDSSTLKSIAGTTGAYIYKPEATQWSQGFLEILTKICSPGTGGNPTPTVVKPTATPKPPTPTSTPKPPTPTISACVIPPPKDPPISICAPEGGLGSITWAWPSIRIATQYEVDIVDNNDKVIVDNDWLPAATFNCATGAECTYTTPNLAIGSYKSKIRAGSPESQCPPSTVSISKRMEVKACPVAPTGQPCASSPVDIVLSLDRSGSMNSGKVNGKTKLEWEKNAAKAFVETLRGQKNVRIGVVSWGGDNFKLKSLDLQTNFDTVIQFIDSITFSSSDQYTCIECAINKSASILMSSKNRKVIILMSDGIGNRIITSCDSKGTCTNPTPPKCDTDKYSGIHCTQADTAAKAIARTTKAEGIDIHVVGYGTQKPSRIQESTLKVIAGSRITNNGNDFYHYGGDETSWDIVFANIAPQICKESKEKVKAHVKKSVERNKKVGSKHEPDQGDD